MLLWLLSPSLAIRGKRTGRAKVRKLMDSDKDSFIRKLEGGKDGKKKPSSLGHLFPVLLLNMMPYNTDYPIGRLGSTILAVSTHTSFCTPAYLLAGQHEKYSGMSLAKVAVQERCPRKGRFLWLGPLIVSLNT